MKENWKTQSWNFGNEKVHNGDANESYGILCVMWDVTFINIPSSNHTIHMNESSGYLTKINETLQQSLEITEVRVRQSQVKTIHPGLQPGKTALLEALCLVIAY